MNEEIERQARLKEIEALETILKKRKNEFEANYQLVYSTDANTKFKLHYKEKEYAKKRE